MRTFLIATPIAVSALLAVPAAQAPPSQERPAGPDQPAVTFRIEVNYVEVDALVTDAQGNPVRGLTKDDFEVREDGKPQAVTVFATVDIPIERAERPLFAPAPIEPDVQSNAREFDGRLFVLVLDDLHTHALRSGQVRRAARQFVDRYLGDNDMAAVLHTSGRADASQDFTGKKRLLREAIDKFVGRKTRSATLGKIDEYYRRLGTPDAGDPLRDPDDFERGYQARSTLDSLKALAEWMAGIHGRRKAVVLLSEGIDYDISDPFNNRYASTVLQSTQDLIGAATRSNVSIYSIDPRGLTSLGDESIELQALPPEGPPDLGNTGLYNELRIAQDSLRTLAEETGGFAAVNSNDFQGAFERLIEETSVYYVLGYYPANDRRDGRFRRIDVRVTRPGLQVRARKGYVAPRGRPAQRSADAAAEGTSTALREVLDSPLPVSGLTLSATAAPFKGVEPNASVLVSVEISGRDLRFVERDGRFVDNVELSLVAFDHTGKVKGGDRNSLKLDLRPQTHDVVSRYGVRLTSRLDLPPGRYQLRIAAREENEGRSGSVLYDLVVPDYRQAPLHLSGVLLTSKAASRTPTIKEDAEIKSVLPAQPTTEREFTAGDELVVFAEIYDNRPSTPHTVDITTTVLSDEGTVRYKTEDERNSAELQGARGGYGFTTTVPLQDLDAGLYVLRVEARSRLGDTTTRDVQFRVVSAPAGGR